MRRFGAVYCGSLRGRNARSRQSLEQQSSERATKHRVRRSKVAVQLDNRSGLYGVREPAAVPTDSLYRGLDRGSSGLRVVQLQRQQRRVEHHAEEQEPRNAKSRRSCNGKANRAACSNPVSADKVHQFEGVVQPGWTPFQDSGGHSADAAVAL